MGVLSKYLKPEPVFDEVILPVANMTIKLKRPTNREVQIMATEFKDYLNEPSNAVVTAILLKMFMNDIEVNNANIEDLISDMEQGFLEDTMAIIKWWYDRQGFDIAELARASVESDFRSRTENVR